MKPDGKAEPRFDIDKSYGGQGELQIADLLTWLANGNGRIEVKRKRYLDLDFYVETECDKGKTGHYRPSGISVTTADAWAFVIGDTGISIIIPTDELRSILDEPGTRDREERDGTCPTRGKLINLGVLLYRYKRRHQPHAPKPAKPAPRPNGQPLAAADIRWG
jgi:hypothetical protein